jgi:hypothetical protein
LAADGSAEFAGIATAKGLNLKPTDGTGGIYIIDKNDASKSSVVITEDGSATFTGQVNTGASAVISNATTTGTSYFSCSDEVGGYSAKITFFSGGSATFAGTVTASNVTFNLAADDDSQYETSTETYTDTETYTGPLGNSLTRDVENTREVKTYVGPVLNVRDELQSLRSRATQQDETIRLMTSALKSLGADVSAFPAPDSEQT